MKKSELVARYAQNGVWWLLHDTLVHPVTGALGFAGRLIGSVRLMALSHHIHNATAPSNDAWADYAEAAHRAGCNEGTLIDTAGEVRELQRKVYETNQRIARLEVLLEQLLRHQDGGNDGLPESEKGRDE